MNIQVFRETSESSPSSHINTFSKLSVQSLAYKVPHVNTGNNKNTWCCVSYFCTLKHIIYLKGNNKLNAQ